MALFLGIIAAFLGLGALSVIALFFSCDKAAQCEHEERMNDHETIRSTR